MVQCNHPSKMGIDLQCVLELYYGATEVMEKKIRESLYKYLFTNALHKASVTSNKHV